jgi:hypothetical protein
MRGLLALWSACCPLGMHDITADPRVPVSCAAPNHATASEGVQAQETLNALIGTLLKSVAE